MSCNELRINERGKLECVRCKMEHDPTPVAPATHDATEVTDVTPPREAAQSGAEGECTRTVVSPTCRICGQTCSQLQEQIDALKAEIERLKGECMALSEQAGQDQETINGLKAQVARKQLEREHWEGEYITAERGRLSAVESALKALAAKAQAEGERDAARAIVARVNNSVIGSHGYFTEPSCVDAVEKLKAHSNTLAAENARLREALKEQCACDGLNDLAEMAGQPRTEVCDPCSALSTPTPASGGGKAKWIAEGLRKAAELFPAHPHFRDMLRAEAARLEAGEGD
jgi:hypothetical protein